MNKDDKLKALDAALTQIEKAYGKGSVMKPRRFRRKYEYRDGSDRFSEP